MTYFTRLDAVFMSTDLTAQLLGLEVTDYVSTFLELIGDEPQCLRTTHMGWADGTGKGRDHKSQVVGLGRYF